VSDFCYSRPMLNRIFRHAELMDRMMERVGVDPGVAVRLDRGMVWYEARSTCVSCCKEQQCHRWLQGSKGLQAPPEFCPNAEFFHCYTAAKDRASLINGEPP
jgi:Family of unknown function (DUF6455)